MSSVQIQAVQASASLRKLALRALFPSLLALSTAAQAPYRINSGGPAYVDSIGNSWTSDEGFYNTGPPYETLEVVTGTADPFLYQTERYDRSTGAEMAYTFPVAPGVYRVRLHFAEIFDGILAPGERIFDVAIEGQFVLQNYDIFAQVGPYAATIEEFVVPVQDTALSIVFFHVVQNPKINAIEVLPAEGDLSVSPAELDLGSVVIGSSGQQMLTLTNIGAADLTITDMLLMGSNPSSFGFVAPPLPWTLVPSEQGLVDVSFSPPAAGPASAALMISTDVPGDDAVIGLTGIGLRPPTLAVAPLALDYGEVILGTGPRLLDLTLSNTGDLALDLTGFSIQGDAAAEFTLVDPAPLTLAASESFPLEVAFQPTSAGFRMATLHIESNDPLGPTIVGLAGDALQRRRPPNQSGSHTGDVGAGPTVVHESLVRPGLLDFGMSVAGYVSAPRTLQVLNKGNGAALVRSASFSGTDFQLITPIPTLVLPGGTAFLDLTFTPTEVGLRTDTLVLRVSDALFEVALTGEGLVPGPPSLILGAMQLDFGEVEATNDSSTMQLHLSNAGQSSLTISAMDFEGSPDFSSSSQAPIEILPGAGMKIDVTFAPMSAGPHSGTLHIVSDDPGRDAYVALTGVGLEPPPDPKLWIAAGLDAGATYSGAMTHTIQYSNGKDADAMLDSLMPTLVLANSSVGDPDGTDLSDRVEYQVTLPVDGDWYLWGRFYHPGEAPSDANSFFVSVDGGPAWIFGNHTGFPQHWHWHGDGSVETGSVAPLALGSLSAGVHTLAVIKREVQPIPPRLDVLLLTLDALALPSDKQAVAALQPSELEAEPKVLAWGHVPLFTPGEVLQLTLDNPSPFPAHISSLSFENLSGAGHDFSFALEGQEFTGEDHDVSYTLAVTIPPGENRVATLEYLPTEALDNHVLLGLGGNFAPVQVELFGTAGEPTGDPFLHVVIEVDPIFVDYDADGSEDVFLNGTGSHTHEFGHDLVGYEWTEEGALLSTEVAPTLPFALGMHHVQLRIIDDNSPPRTLTDEAEIRVVTPAEIPGVLALYYPADGSGPLPLLDDVPALPGAGEVRGNFLVLAQGGNVGGSPYPGNLMVRLLGAVSLPQAGEYEFQVSGGIGHRVILDGLPVSGPLQLAAGSHQLEVRVALDTLADLPLEVLLASEGGTAEQIDPALLSHDQSGLPPVISSAPSEGLDLGGNQVTIMGLGFFPASQVVVHWGTVDFGLASLEEVLPNSIALTAPPGTGQISVTVETPNGISNAFQYTYAPTGPIPIQFSLETLTGSADPTQADWGPDGRLYVGSIGGRITAYTFDDDYNVVDVQVIPTLEPLSNDGILGLTFSPFDPADPVRIYVAHNQLFANGGSCLGGSCPSVFSPYSGQISVLEGPFFDTLEPLVTGLPVSNHDHGVNGMQFDNNGDLLVCVGGNTNAGVEHCNLGELPESPFSGAILRVSPYRSKFQGHVHYLETATGFPNDNQVCAAEVDAISDIHVEVFAAGLRNPFDLVFSTRGLLYATDNGPDANFGAASTSASTQGPDPDDIDELNLIEQGHYYGHPNRNRGRNDPRQNVYHGSAAPSIPGEFDQAITTFPSSTDGLTQYRAQTFRGALRGQLLAQKWRNSTFRVVLSPDGRTVLSRPLFVAMGSLDIVASPGGTVIGVDYSRDQLLLARPVDLGAVGLTVYDVFPWRAAPDGSQPFVIGGANLGNLAETHVTVGGQEALLTSVSATRIRGMFPASAAPTSELLDIVVTRGTQSVRLPAAFRYVFAPGNEPLHNVWSGASAPPAALGEVASGWIGDLMVLVGEDSSNTLRFDANTGTWATGSIRPFLGHHHAAEVIGDKLYLFGGLEGSSDGKVQIYDPALDSWSLGADMPWAGGSVNTALISGKVYACGGIVGSSTVVHTAAYDPLLDSWSQLLSPMPAGRNHAAAATEGARLFVFGGRGPGSGDGNQVANGFADVQIYNPSTNSWEWSGASGSSLLPLPQARGGMGKAVYFGGEFYVMGGETLNGPGANADGTYDRVDVYDPYANTWRLGAPMPSARHGIFPALHRGVIHVAAGGRRAGHSESTRHEVYTP